MTNPIPKPLLDQVHALTTGEVDASVHHSSRLRFLERRPKARVARWWQSPLVAGAVLVVLVVLVVNASMRRNDAPVTEHSVATATETDEKSHKLEDAEVVLRGLRPRFRECYQAGLNEDPTLAGKVVIAAMVNPKGDVASASIQSFEGLTPKVRECLVQVVREAHFKGNGHSTTLTVPVTFASRGR